MTSSESFSPSPMEKLATVHMLEILAVVDGILSTLDRNTLEWDTQFD